MKRAAANIGLMVVSLATAILLAEIALRLLWTNPSFFALDPVRGFIAHRPDSKGWQTKEGRTYVTINSDGLRDRAHALDKPENTFRIAVLGDSYAEAAQVKMEDAFWSVMERQLGKCKAVQGRTIEVINFGVSGYGTGLEWITLQRRAWQYNPDLVLLAFLTANDVRNNSFALNRDPSVPYFYLHKNSLLVAPPRVPPTMVRKLLGTALHDFLHAHSRIGQLISYYRALRREATKVRSPDIVGIEAGVDNEIFSEPGVDNEIFSEPRNDNWRLAWEVTESIIRGMHREVEARGKVLFIATLSAPIQVHPDRNIRTAFMKRLGLTDLLYGDRRVIDVARTERIPSVMLAPTLLDWAKQNNTCVHGFQNATPCGGHWNQHGHKLAGEILAAEICTKVLSGQ